MQANPNPRGSQDRGEAALSAFTEQMTALRPGDPMDPATTLEPVSSERALELLLGQIDAAEKDGARVVVEIVGLYCSLVAMQAIGLYNRHHSDRFPWDAG